MSAFGCRALDAFVKACRLCLSAPRFFSWVGKVARSISFGRGAELLTELLTHDQHAQQPEYIERSTMSFLWVSVRWSSLSEASSSSSCRHSPPPARFPDRRAKIQSAQSDFTREVASCESLWLRPNNRGDKKCTLRPITRTISAHTLRRSIAACSCTRWYRDGQNSRRSVYQQVTNTQNPAV